jgi:dTDP-4-amino-4,6-dideoxygalactose transaminase
VVNCPNSGLDSLGSNGSGCFITAQVLQAPLVVSTSIQTRPIFSGNILRHPAFKIIRGYNKISNFPNADEVMDTGILIGCHQGLKINNINYVTKKMQIFLKKFCN